MFKGPSAKAVLDWELVEAEVAARVMMLAIFFFLFLFAKTWSSLPFSSK